KIGIIGGSGYIGSTIACALSETSQIVVIDQVPLRKNPNGRITYRQCDITKYDEVKNALEGLDLVIHTAIIQIPLINENRRLGFEVNFIGTQNICRCIDQSPTLKGMLLTGTWHVFGERGIWGNLDESFGFRPDNVEERARLYALSKVAQEVVVRYYDEMSSKIYGIIRLGTVLGEGMPEKTAANIFICNALAGKTLTPFKHSMYRPMLYVDVADVCTAFKMYARKIIDGEVAENENSLAHIVNLYWPTPITVFDLAKAVSEATTKLTQGKIQPKIEIIDNGLPVLFEENDKLKMRANTDKINQFLGITSMTDPYTTLEKLIAKKFHETCTSAC
ncbi:MAG: NAD-dependent epimerase/dehydratase family protein, partial [Chloroflexota bacterium]